MENSYKRWLYWISPEWCTWHKLISYLMNGYLINIRLPESWSAHRKEGWIENVPWGGSIRARPCQETRVSVSSAELDTGNYSGGEKGMTFTSHSFFHYWLPDWSIQSSTLRTWPLCPWYCAWVREMESTATPLITLHLPDIWAVRWMMVSRALPQISEKKRSYLKQQVSENGLACALDPGFPISPIPFASRHYKKNCSKIPHTLKSHFLCTHTQTHIPTPLFISMGFCIGGERSISSIC